jgi:hypothetical protein
MMPLERRKPDLLKARRRLRVAAGAGEQAQEVDRLLDQYEQVRGMMNEMRGGGLMKIIKHMVGMKRMMPPGMLSCRPGRAGTLAPVEQPGVARSGAPGTRRPDGQAGNLGAGGDRRGFGRLPVAPPARAAGRC